MITKKLSQPIMDVCFVIDATNSMQEVIHAAHDKAQQIAFDLKTTHPRVDFKFATVCYRDPVDSRTDKHQWMDFDGEIDNLVEFYSKIVAYGGGDLPEDWVGAFFIALHKLSWRNGAKSMIWITDMNAHGRRFCGFYNHQNQENPLCKLVGESASNQIVYFGLSINNGADKTFEEIMKMYKMSGFDKFSYQAFSPTAQIDASVETIEEEEDVPEEEKKEEPVKLEQAEEKKNEPEILDVNKPKKKKRRVAKKSRTKESKNIGNYFRSATLRACDLALLGYYGESEKPEEIPEQAVTKSISSEALINEKKEEEIDIKESDFNFSVLEDEKEGKTKTLEAAIDEPAKEEIIEIGEVTERNVSIQPEKQKKDEVIAVTEEKKEQEKNVNDQIEEPVAIMKQERKQINNCCNYFLLILALIAAIYVAMYRNTIRNTTIEMDPIDLEQI